MSVPRAGEIPLMPPACHPSCDGPNTVPLHLAILPFEGTDSQDLQTLIRDLAELGMAAELLSPVALPADAYDARRGQWRAEVLLERVREHRGKRVLGVTDRDLYAGDLNFVFGMAQMPGRAAVISLHRLHAPNRRLFRLRALKEAVHELGHTLGLPHCPNPACVMHFSNSLADTDRKGPIYCPACLAKLKAVC